MDIVPVDWSRSIQWFLRSAQQIVGDVMASPAHERTTDFLFYVPLEVFQLVTDPTQDVGYSGKGFPASVITICDSTMKQECL